MKNTVKTITIGAGAAVLLGLALGQACATKKMVVEQVATIDKKVEGIETSVEENQKRIKEHDSKLGAHDERLASIGTLIGQHDKQFKDVDGRLDEVRKIAQGKLIDTVTVRNGEAKFKSDSFELSREAKATLDAFVQKLVADNRGVYLEIQGHTDKTGPEEWNLMLGKKRAEAVLEYLYRQHHIPLHRMQVIGMGSADPVDDNRTAAGRAKNRRVEILVYE
jgi:outer membrane protein OmpA-like peptidoglycan-associated protein